MTFPCTPCSASPMVVCLLAMLAGPAAAQQFPFSREIRFAQYLQNREQYGEARQVLMQIDTQALSRPQRDTIHYLAAWGDYSVKALDRAADGFLQVSPSFPLYTRSRFFAAYCLAFRAGYDASAHVLQHLPVTDSVNAEMKAFQLAGIALLQRDYAAYRQLQPLFTYSFYAMQQEEHRFADYYSRLTGYHKKSPLLAGVYSALLPGAGKFYAGKKKQGIAAFLPVLSLGAITYEAYRKGGTGSARFLTFGALFSVFYVGNIWGSVLSVRIKEKEFYREYDNKILFDLHIPLRNLYN